MPAFLLTPIARWALLAAVVAAVAGWGALERAGRQAAVLREAAAVVRAEAAEARIRNMEARNAVDDGVRREPRPADRLRDEWSRGD
jgi:hypothetical protein